MNIRHPVLTGIAVLIMPCLASGAIPQHDNYEHLGVQSCAASSCHGSAGERSTYSVLQNEYITWARHDLHSQAYAVLKNEQSQRIAENLGLEAAHTAKICLDCHSDNVPEQRRGLQFALSDGVACEACHGGAEKWLGVHISSGRDKHAESLAAGMYPTEDPVARAALCLSCHLGTSDKFATHEIMGAGHPRIAFDLQKFTDLQPRHYRVDADYRARKHFVEDTRVWAIGQVSAARQYLGFLQGTRLSGGGMFPELSLFDCHACHRSFQDHRWQASERSATPPGTVLLNDSALAMSHVIAKVVLPGAASSMLGAIRELHRASQTDPAALRDAAARLDRQLAQLADGLNDQSFDRQRNRQMMEALRAEVGEGQFSDYSDAEQATMALDVYSGVTGLYKTEVDALYEAVADLAVMDAKRFDPVLFAAVFNRSAIAAVTPVSMQRQSNTPKPAPLTKKPGHDRPATRPVNKSDGTDMPARSYEQANGRASQRLPDDPPESRPGSFSPTHRVDTPALRLRFTPDTRDRIAVILYSGDPVQILDTSGQWAEVAYVSNGVVRTGWALSRLIEEMVDENRPPNPALNRIMNRSTPVIRLAQTDRTGTATAPLVTSAPLETGSRPEKIVPTHVVDTAALNVRFTPDTSARIAVILYVGTDVQVLENAGAWSHVAYDSKGVVRTGWAVSRSLREKSTDGTVRSPEPVIDQQAPRPEPEPPRVTTITPPLVSDAPIDAAPRPDRIVPTHIVDANALNVRFTPDSDARIAVILYSGNLVQVLASNGDWSRIAYDSNGVVRTGWAVSRLLREQSAARTTLPEVRAADRPVDRPTAVPVPVDRPAEPEPGTSAPAVADETPPMPEPVDRPAAPEPKTTAPAVADETPPMPEPVDRPAALEPKTTAPAVADETPPTAVSPLAEIVPTHIVGAYKLRLRSEPDPDAEIVIVLDSGDEVQMLESAGEWTQVVFKSNGVVSTGWVASGLIVERPADRPKVEKPVLDSSAPGSAEPDGAQTTPSSSRAVQADAPATTQQSVTRSPLVATSRLVTNRVINADGAQVRLQPNRDSGIRDVLDRGVGVRFLQRAGQWSRIAYPADSATRTGWVPSRYLDELPASRR